MPGKRIYFPNLDALRFLAALAVFCHHTERFLSRQDLPSFAHLDSVHALGGLGVTFFFVLSGYLITYLLLVEIESTGTVRVRDFYVRRLLRIWPLYYFLLFLGLLALPLAGAAGMGFKPWDVVAMFVLFIPNVAVAVRPLVGFISHTWSIGVEEQFYLLWPALLRVFRKPLRVLFGVIVVYGAVFVYVKFFMPHGAGRGSLWRIVRLTRIDCMAIGGLAAYAAKEHLSTVLRVVSNRVVQGLVLGTVAVLLATGASLPLGTHEAYGVLFALVIMMLSLPEKTIVSLEHPWLRYLGRVSYGFYMYHPMCIALGMWAIRPTGVYEWSTGVGRVCLYIAAFAATVLASGLSYRLLESPFLKLKARFTSVKSGAPAVG